VIVLNGTSSSGKSTLSRALQARLDGPWLGIGIDTVVFALPSAYLDQPGWTEVFRYVPAEPGSDAPFRVETGEFGERLIRGMHGMVAALAARGLDVIVDHVLLEREWLDDLAAALRGVPVLFVGVRCPLEVVVERERARRDRTLGQAAAHFDVVHEADGYDLEVDTSTMTADEAAGAIAGRLETDGFPIRPFGRVPQPRVPAAVKPAAGIGS
jgi:chloramphenicol 3-O phosphotransferase